MDEIKERAERLLNISPKIMMSFSRMHSSQKAEMTFNQYQALLIISGLKSCSINELALKLRLAQSTTSQLADRLVHAKFIEREINPDNRRSITISLTKEGEKMMNKRTATMKKGYERILDMMTPEDQEKFEEAFQIIYHITAKFEKYY